MYLLHRILHKLDNNYGRYGCKLMWALKCSGAFNAPTLTELVNHSPIFMNISLSDFIRLDEKKNVRVIGNTIPNYSQQDATFFFFIYFYRRSTCFRRFLRPSSEAHNCTYSFRYCQPILLLAATVEEMALVQLWLTIPEAVCTVMCY